MARISVVDLPRNKRIQIALTYLYGIGHKRAQQILSELRIDGSVKAGELPDQQVNEIREYIEKEKSAFLKDYRRIVESPSVSSQQEHKKDILETAKIACELIHAVGGEAKIIETKGNPVVFGRIENDPKAPTVAIYNHIDVNPADLLIVRCYPTTFIFKAKYRRILTQ